MTAFRWRFLFPAVLVAVCLFALCVVTAVSLFRQQATVTEVLRENVSSRRAAADLRGVLNTVVALETNRVEQVAEHHTRAQGYLDDIRRLANQPREAELSRELDLDSLLDRPAGQLSAGQKTRVALAKSLINRPELLLLDEPTASLDPDTGDLVRTWLERYRAETGCAILLASHNMAEVERLCSHVLMLKQGRVVDRGSPRDLLNRYGRDDLEDVFLDIARDRRTSREPEPAA